MKVFHNKDLTTENLDEGEEVSEKKEKGKKKAERAQKNAVAEKKPSADAPAEKRAQLDDVSLGQEFYEEIRLQRVIDVVKRAVFLLAAAVFLFISGSYLIYLYSDLGFLDVAVKDHEHVYSEVGVRTDGDCKHFGYWSYPCTVPYCKSDKQVWDSVPGNHKYNLSEYTPEEKEFEIDGEKIRDVYRVYTCDICGGLNKVFDHTESVKGNMGE